MHGLNSGTEFEFFCCTWDKTEDKSIIHALIVEKSIPKLTRFNIYKIEY